MKEQMLIAGKHSVYEAIISGSKIKEIMFLKSKEQNLNILLTAARQAKIKIKAVEYNEINKLYKGNHQGVVVFLDEFKYAELEEIVNRTKNSNKRFFAVILDHLQDPHNLGAIIRTGCVFGITCVIIPKNRSVHVTPSVLKIASGGCEHLPIVMVNNIVQAIEFLKKNNIWIYAADFNGENVFKTKFSADLAIVIGAEGKGVSHLVRQKSDFLISIPMPGKPLSLNASVAAGVIIAEVTKQCLN